MPQDAAQIRGKIISFIRDNGPSLPVQISKETGLSILFASAFLSELLSEKIIQMSNLRIGSSPLYFIHGQEPQLERFAQYLKSKEKDAFLILQEKKILKDSELHPAIRVALREIKDYAFSFNRNGEIYWRYFLTEEPEKIEIEKTEAKDEKINIGEQIFEKGISQIENTSPRGGRELSSENSNAANEENKQVSKKESHPKIPKSEKEEKPKKTAKTEKKEDNFFNKIKEYLSARNVEIVDIKDFKNNQAVLKIKKEGKEELLFVFNKKRIAEKEILDAHKKASEEKMPYSILSLGETTKKLGDLIQAIKGLSSMDRIE